MNISCANTSLNCTDSSASLKRADKEQQPTATSAVSRRSRIENIFLLCGNRRELAAQKQNSEFSQMGTNNTMSEHNSQSEDHTSSNYTSSQGNYTDGFPLLSLNDSTMSTEVSKGTQAMVLHMCYCQNQGTHGQKILLLGVQCTYINLLFTIIRI